MRNDAKLKAAAVATSIALAFPGGIAIAEEATTTASTSTEQTAQVADAEQATDTEQANQATDAEQTTQVADDNVSTTDAIAQRDEATANKTEAEGDTSSTASTSGEDATSNNIDLSAQTTSTEMVSEGWKEAAPKEGETWKDVDGYRLYYREGSDIPTSWAKLSDDGVPMSVGIKVTMDAVDFGDYRLIANGAPMVQRVINYKDINPDELIPFNKENPNNMAYWYKDAWYTLLDDGRLYAILNGDPGAPSGVSAGADVSSGPVRAADTTKYESGTLTLTPATGTAYVSPTASVATPDANSEATPAAIPATSDSTSLVGVFVAIAAAVGAFIGAKVLRNRG